MRGRLDICVSVQRKGCCQPLRLLSLMVAVMSVASHLLGRYQDSYHFRKMLCLIGIGLESIGMMRLWPE